MNPDWRARYEVAVEAAARAARLALGYFQTHVTVEWKHDMSPVTAADREAEQLLRTILLSAFPSDGFLGEESGDTPGSSGYRWIIDPVDGTRSFVRGIPLWATLVGLEYKGEQIAGVVDAPALGDSYRALRGDGAFRNGKPIRVSTVTTLAKSHLYYSSISWFVKAGLEHQFLELTRRTERQRGFGDFYGFILVAQGSGEIMLEWGTHPWDLSALTAIICEAGGQVTGWDGTPTIYRPDVLATNGLVHDEVRGLLQRMMRDAR